MKKNLLSNKNIILYMLISVVLQFIVEYFEWVLQMTDIAYILDIFNTILEEVILVVVIIKIVKMIRRAKKSVGNTISKVCLWIILAIAYIMIVRSIIYGVQAFI